MTIEPDHWNTRLPPYEILGLSLVGPPPLGAAHIRWRNALIVLYGLNGAGKSTILRGIHDALTGSRTSNGNAYLHIQLAETAFKNFFFEDFAFLKDLIGGVREWIHSAASRPRGEAPAWTADWADPSEVVDPDEILRMAISASVASNHAVDSRLWGMAADPAERRILTLWANGHGWTVLPSVPVSTQRPSEIRRMRQESDPQDERFREGNTLANSAQNHSDVFASAGDIPDWVPFPIGVIGQFQSKHGPQVIELKSESPDKVTNDYLSSMDWFDSAGEDGGPGALIEFTEQGRLSEVQETANEFFSDFVPEFPTLTLKLLSPHEWLRGRIVSWSATDRSTGTSVPIAALSEAQGKWVSLAVQASLWAQDLALFHAAMLIEEPELGLHPTAIARVAEGLSENAQQGMPTIVTSHSPSFLNVADASLIHVFRDPEREGLATTEPLEDALRRGLDLLVAKLGLDRGAALQLHRVFLVVEGKHDEVVLKEVFDDEWDLSRTRILRMEGSYHTLSVAGCEVLLEFSDANVVVLLDNAGGNGIPKVWEATRLLAMEGKTAEARRQLENVERRLSGSLSQEERVALKFAHAAIGTKPSHLHLFGLTKRDIILYLDISVFLPGAKSWAAVSDDYQIYRSDPRAKDDFKTWLRKFRNAQTTTEKVRHAARLLADAPPSEFSALLDLCVRLSAGRGPMTSK